jgi:HPt (histidine-containing phosphotransfer) domain-containing protein
LKGDRERCLAAGMDAYISKPIRARQLFDVIESVLDPAAPSESAPPTPAAGSADDAPCDWSQVLKELQGDVDVLRHVAEASLEESPRLMRAIRAAFETGDAPALAEATHTLKGSLRYFGGERSVEIAQALEDMARRNDLSRAEDAVVGLEKEIARLAPVLTRFVHTGQLPQEQSGES